MSSFEIDYEEDLISRIQNLIVSYDKDSILKEYLQNADDSGATELIITFDKQNYNNLIDTPFEQAKGNALLIYNNSQFKDKDFKSIVKISARGKTGNANSTGRFGQGFSSSFSISDHPSFISNGRAYWFDVLKVAVSKDKTKSIQGWKYQNSNEINPWLDTFKIAGFKKNTNFNVTIFRLPLRDKISSENSKISNEIFTYEDFLKWVDEWKKGSKNLLFLRHIHRLVLQEADETGNIKILLEIKTENKEEIENINNQIQNEFNGKTLLEICKNWEIHDKNLPIFQYKHNFQIRYANQVEYKTYAVVNGLFRGTDNNLIEKAKRVLDITQNPRKVLSWAGVAVELNSNNEPIKTESKLFTFLPLPIKSNYPVHIHGWFDLNSYRTQITYHGSGYDNEVSIEWNQLLLKEGVAKAWSLLIDYLKKESKENYIFWAKDTEFSLNDYLIEGFYENISNLSCLYTMYKDTKEWLSPKENELFYLKRDTNDKIMEPLQKHFKIVLSKPPNYIVENFSDIGIELTEITPEFLRDYLKEESKNIQFPIAIDNMPIAMLQKKEWLIEVLKFCAGDEKYDLIDGLPLELTLDKSIYKVESDVLFDSNPNLILFQDLKYLFIDQTIVNAIENRDNLPDSWLSPTLKNKLSLLYEYWDELEISKEWIEEIIHEIENSSKEEIEDALEVIQKLEIVYQEDESYTTLFSSIEEFSPFMPRDEDIPNNLTYLERIGMNVIHRDYIKLYKPLLEYDGLITQLSSVTLIKHLLNLDDFSFFKDKDTRECIIDLMTKKIEWFDSLSSFEKSQFYETPFIETVDSRLYAKNSDVKLYLPSDFTPPKDIESLTDEYEVISVEPNTNLYALYKKMDIDTLDIENYIKDVIIPFLENTDNIFDRREVLKWLAKEWNNIKNKIDDKIIEKFKNSKIIPSLEDESQLFKANELYIPTIKLPPILDDNQFKSIIFEEEFINKGWIEFLSFLGASEKILSTHIIKKIEEISQDKDKNNAIKLLNYIANHFEIFEEMHILDTLKEYAWFPVEEPKEILKPKNTYSPLKKPNELILKKDVKIAGGYYHLLDTRVKLGKKDEKGEIKPYEMAKKLGITTNIPNEHFFESFRELIKLTPTNGQVANYAKEVYKYIGRRFNHSNEIELDKNKKTILINSQWIEPKYVYQLNINLSNIYSWNSLVKEDDIESELAEGLKLLGVQDKPSLDFLIEFLKQLPQEEKLRDNHLKDAKAILKAIQEDEENDIYDDIPILTQQNILMDPSKVYINDFPAYKKAADKNENLYFCQTQFEPLAKKLNILSINENYKSKIDFYEQSDSSHPIVETIETDYFKEALLRLLYHEKKIEEDEINEDLLYDVLPSNIIFVCSLIIKYTIEDNFLFKSEETTYETNGELYVLKQDDEDDMIELIAKYICDTKNLSRDSFGWLERILRKQMNREAIHNFLDKKKVIELPKKLDIEDEPSLFDESENLPETDIETVSDETTNKEEKYRQTNNISKENIAPPTKPRVSHGDKRKISTSQKDGERKKDIQPPLQPKTSSEIKRSDSNSNSNFTNRQGNRTNNYKSDSSARSNRKIISPNDRKPVYVGKEDLNAGDRSKEQKSMAEEIGELGENYLLKLAKKYVLSPDNDFYKASPNNKGYDITEENRSSGRIVRYIEVKTLTGKWGEGGVSVTEHQFDFAQKQKDRWWLFVIEGINTDSPKVYQFKNPVVEANRFMFDSSWKQLAYQKEDIANQEPKVGDKYEIKIDGEQKIAEITNIKDKGALSKVEMVLENGQKVKVRFKKSWKKIDG